MNLFNELIRIFEDSAAGCRHQRAAALGTRADTWDNGEKAFSTNSSSSNNNNNIPNGILSFDGREKFSGSSDPDRNGCAELPTFSRHKVVPPFLVMGGEMMDEQCVTRHDRSVRVRKRENGFVIGRLTSLQLPLFDFPQIIATFPFGGIGLVQF